MKTYRNLGAHKKGRSYAMLKQKSPQEKKKRKVGCIHERRENRNRRRTRKRNYLSGPRLSKRGKKSFFHGGRK